MILDSERGTNAIFVDLDESGFTLFVAHVSCNGNEVTCHGFNRKGPINDNQLMLAVNSGQSSNFV